MKLIGRCRRVAWLLSLLSAIGVSGQIEEYFKYNDNGDGSISLGKCPSCPKGHEPLVPCGLVPTDVSVLSEDHKKCRPCKPGWYQSDMNSVHRCSECFVSKDPHMQIDRKCTIYNPPLYSCIEGFFKDHIGDCQKCCPESGCYVWDDKRVKRCLDYFNDCPCGSHPQQRAKISSMKGAKKKKPRSLENSTNDSDSDSKNDSKKDSGPITASADNYALPLYIASGCFIVIVAIGIFIVRCKADISERKNGLDQLLPDSEAYLVDAVELKPILEDYGLHENESLSNVDGVEQLEIMRLCSGIEQKDDLQKYFQDIKVHVAVKLHLRMGLLDILKEHLPAEGHDLYQYMLAFKRDHSHRLRRVLKKAQWNKMVPDDSRVTVSFTSDYDTTLILVLLTNNPNIEPPQTGWGTEPSVIDLSRSAYIERAREVRNHVIHSVFGSFTNHDDQFEDIWVRIRSILVGLHYSQEKLAKFDELKELPLPRIQAILNNTDEDGGNTSAAYTEPRPSLNSFGPEFAFIHTRLDDILRRLPLQD